LVYSKKYHKLIEAGAPTIEEEQIAVVDSANGNRAIGTINTPPSIGEIYTGCIAPNGSYYGLTSNPCFGCNTPGDNVMCYTISGKHLPLHGTN
jgi:hypothetical protein